MAYEDAYRVIREQCPLAELRTAETQASMVSSGEKSVEEAIDYIQAGGW